MAEKKTAAKAPAKSRAKTKAVAKAQPRLKALYNTELKADRKSVV